MDNFILVNYYLFILPLHMAKIGRPKKEHTEPIKSVNFRIGDEYASLLAAITAKEGTGATQVGVLRRLIKAEAARQEITLPEQ